MSHRDLSESARNYSKKGFERIIDLARSTSLHRQTKPSPFDGASSFVIKSLQQIPLNKGARALDLPCGFGRHAICLAERGYKVVGVDLDRNRLEALRVHLRSQPQLDISLRNFDAEKRWPLAAETFDLVVIVDYVGKLIFSESKRVLRKRGYLLYQSFGARGSNWRSLPRLGSTEKSLSSWANLLYLQQGPTGPARDRETIRLVAQRRS
jgi:SAM-dependent methyltransferase